MKQPEDSRTSDLFVNSENKSQCWTGRGQKPRWVRDLLAAGGTLGRMSALSSGSRGPYVKLPGAWGQRTFGAYIVLCRRDRNMTQAQYAASLNVSRRSLVMAEQLVIRPFKPLGTVAKFAAAEFKSWFDLVQLFDIWSQYEAAA